MVVKTVAVIGAGVSGVSTGIHLRNAGLDVTVFERGIKAGGVWIFDERSPLEPAYPSILPSVGDSPELEQFLEQEKNEERSRRDSPVGFDEVDGTLEVQHAPPGPCYEGLTNNVSTTEMELKANKWRPGTADFVKHNVLAEYIQDTARVTGLEDAIEFQTRVNHVEKAGEKWKVYTTTLAKDDGVKRIVTNIRDFDAVVVASGHYHAPNIPDLPGLAELKQRFPDRVQHSKGYRHPSGFADKNVLLIGAGVSSTDIARELGPLADRIYQSSRGGLYDLPSNLLPENATRVGAIRGLHFNTDETKPLGSNDTLPGTVRLTSGEEIQDVHHIIVATGYHMSYPFLRRFHADNVSPENASSTTLVTSGQVTHNLHKDIWYIPDPTLAFIGVPYHVATFSLFEFQARALAAVYSGTATLPSEPEMRREYETRVRNKGIGRKFHSLKDNRGEVEYAKEMMVFVNAGRGSGEELEGHSQVWLQAYQRRLIKMETFKKLRLGLGLEVEEEDRKVVKGLGKHPWDSEFEEERAVGVKEVGGPKVQPVEA